MSHLDEGTLHALLDGELGGTELMEIEAHLGGCAACSARLREARGFLEEADRLVGSVQFGGLAAAASPSTSPAPVPAAERAADPASPTPLRPSGDHHSWDDASQVLLIPDNPESVPLIRRSPRAIGWAAGIAIVISVGYYASNVRKETSSPVSSSPAPGSVMASAAESAAVSPPAGALRKDSESPSLADQKVLEEPPAAAKPAPARNLAAKSAAPAGGKAAGAEDPLDAAEEAATRAAEKDAIRVTAALELSKLDRERRAGRAASATADLDQAAAARESRAAGAIPAPAPPTLEQRAQVYTRIGLDEASKQLGGPVHVIEGMSPLFMGLAPGRVAAGADTTRPVVRVVYQDPQGRMIVLDQQRNLPGQAPTSAPGSWILGDLTMGLQGEAPPEVLRTLRSRVR
jgi:Putative zinc-finger